MTANVPANSDELSSLEVYEQLRAGGRIELIDVREPHERAARYIAGSRHIPLAELGAAASSLDNGRALVFVCRVGARSGLATDEFRRAGFEAYNLSGGMVAWARAGLPLSPAADRAESSRLPP